MTHMQKAELLTAGAERARQDGDTVASITLAVAAAQELQLARLFEPESGICDKSQTDQEEENDQ